MSDYRLEVKVKNNNILSKIEQEGYKTVAEFCNKNGKKGWQGVVGELINLQRSPINSRGEYHPCIDWMCDALYCTMEDLFTEVQINTALETNKSTMKVKEAELKFSLSQLKESMSLDEQISEERFPDQINKLLNTLTPREEKVISLRFGIGGQEPMTLKDVGKVFDVNPERVRQIEAKALRKLRHPSRREIVEDYI